LIGKSTAGFGSARSKAALLLLGLLWLAACGEAASVEEGIASFYADSLHGQPTASGDKYDKRDRTAAHRTLPFGTRVKVTNLDNGRSVWVRINDRGPFVDERIIDPSRAAAKKLRFTEKGTARVRLEIYD
jgi:rare lipoprotein A